MARSRNSLTRSPPRLEPKRRFFIFCEGQNTEPHYFNTLARYVNQTIVEIVPIGAAGVPKTLAVQAAEKARGLRKEVRRKKANSYERLDQVWAVFDRDEHPNVPEALQICKTNEVRIGYSNPCFEIWLLLHYCDYNSAEHRHKVQKDLEGQCPTYDRKHSKKVSIDNFLERVKEAEHRAERQLDTRKREGDQHGNPSTTVHLLTRAIRKAAEEHKSR